MHGQPVSFQICYLVYSFLSSIATLDSAGTCVLKEGMATMFKHASQTPPASHKLLSFTTLLNDLLYSEVVTKWEQVGYVLGVNVGLLENIKRKHCQRCFMEMLNEWMKQVNPPPSWSDIISAIENIPGYNSLAQSLRNKYLPKQGDCQGAKAANLFVRGAPSTSHMHEPDIIANGGKFIHQLTSIRMCHNITTHTPSA